jgi:hypothetical protein
MSALPVVEIRLETPQNHSLLNGGPASDNTSNFLSEPPFPRDETVSRTPSPVVVSITEESSGPENSRLQIPTVCEQYGTLPVQNQWNEITTRRMRWIMQLSMDSLLPTLSPDKQALMTGITDLRQLIGPLFHQWEAFRAKRTSVSKLSDFAKTMHQKLKPTATTDFFERFWERKLVAEKDSQAWGRFKSVVKVTLDQVSTIDRILGSANNFSMVCRPLSEYALKTQATFPATAIYGVVVIFLRVLI